MLINPQFSGIHNPTPEPEIPLPEVGSIIFVHDDFYVDIKILP
jgi:hypothetical protein